MANRTDSADNVKIGRLLQEAREYKKVTQQEMSVTIGISKNHISKVERGESKASVSMLLGYCQKLNMYPNEILGYTDARIMPELLAFITNLDMEKQEKLLQVMKVSELLND